MKIITLLILSITLGISLFARLNPFEPTDHFTEQKEMVIKSNELDKIKKEQETADKIAQEEKAKQLEVKKLADEMEAKKLNDELADKKQIEQNKKTMMLVKEKKMLEEKIKKEVTKQEEEVIVKKPYIPEIKENFKILPFVKIDVVNDVLTIKVDTKYKLLNQDILKPVKKLLFDFQGKVSFYTIRKDIISEDFKSLAVGTHMENNFFRVVIDLPEDIINYTEKIDAKQGIITITKKK